VCPWDPEGRIRTDISARDRCALYQLSYPGAVPSSVPQNGARRKMAIAGTLDSDMVERGDLGVRERS
jgi:hypothetical protein